MKHIQAAAAVALLCLSSFISAQSIEGKWKTIDDKTGKARAVVQISEQNGVYSGKVIQMLGDAPNVCTGCDGSAKTFGVAKNGAIVGMPLLRGFKADGDQFSGGSVFDPKSGNTYKGTIKPSADGSKLVLRGYVGWGKLSVGRSQTWLRMD